jgi:hypothetical protein
MGSSSQYSEDVASRIDMQIRSIIQHCHDETVQIIKDNRFLEREFEESLDATSKRFFRFIEQYGDIINLDRFKYITVSRLIDGIHYEIYSTTPEDSVWYDEVFNSLKDYYTDRIEVRYKKLMSEI